MDNEEIQINFTIAELRYLEITARHKIEFYKSIKRDEIKELTYDNWKSIHNKISKILKEK